MMVNLSNDQLFFIETEFNVSENELKDFNIKQWKQLEVLAFDIEVELLPMNDYDEPSDRCKMAISIVDEIYRQLKVIEEQEE